MVATYDHIILTIVSPKMCKELEMNVNRGFTS